MLGDEAFGQLRRAIDELAAVDAAELVAEARIEARAKVRSILAEELAEALLARSRAEMRATRPAVDLGWYVYGVVAAPGPVLPDELPGVDPRLAPLLVVEDDLAAIASQVPLSDFDGEGLRERLADGDWIAERARAHDAVLEVAMVMTTVVPMRLCTVYPNESALRRMLVREHDSLVAGLERFGGKAEWRVSVSAPGAGVHERLAAVSAEALVLDDGEDAFEGAYLVAHGAVEEFHGAVAALNGELAASGCEARPAGPFPPYNFVKGTIEAPW